MAKRPTRSTEADQVPESYKSFWDKIVEFIDSAVRERTAPLMEEIKARPTDPIALLMSAVGPAEERLNQMNRDEVARIQQEFKH